jgi:hypothetical protein
MEDLSTGKTSVDNGKQPTSKTCPDSSGLPADTNMHGAVAASGSQLSLEASDFFFSPTCVTGLHSGTITLTVHNGGVVLHNVSIPQLHIDQDMSPGQTITVVVKMEAPRWCSSASITGVPGCSGRSSRLGAEYATVRGEVREATDFISCAERGRSASPSFGDHMNR